MVADLLMRVLQRRERGAVRPLAVGLDSGVVGLRPGPLRLVRRALQRAGLTSRAGWLPATGYPHNHRVTHRGGLASHCCTGMVRGDEYPVGSSTTPN
jgi:hypothetical protein